MFGPRPHYLDSLISRTTAELASIEPGTEEYSNTLSYLERLVKLKAEDKPERISRNTVAVVLGNLAGILLIVAYEQKHVMTSKAFGTILKTPKDY